MKTPNGKPSNLTERQWLTVRTKAFKNWFGDWENTQRMQAKWWTRTVMDSQTKALVKKNVLVALHVGLKSTESPALNVSKIASAYGKNRIKTIIDTHKILYWNTQKGTVMLNNYRLQLPQAIQHDLSTGKIWEFNDLVNYKKQETIHFSVVGQSAKNWDKIKHRAFRGRDDGKPRVEEVEQNKGVTETLEATRFPKSGPQGSTPKGRIHRIKEFVNYIDSLGEDSFRLIIRLIIGLNMVAYVLYGR